MSAIGATNWIQTGFFEVEPGEDADTNPRVYGRAFARWLAERVKAKGEPVEKVLPEDWGWCILLTRKPMALWIGCSNRDGRTDEWGAFVCAEASFLGRVFGSVNPSGEVARVEALLEEILQHAPGASGVTKEVD